MNPDRTRVIQAAAIPSSPPSVSSSAPDRTGRCGTAGERPERSQIAPYRHPAFNRDRGKPAVDTQFMQQSHIGGVHDHSQARTRIASREAAGRETHAPSSRWRRPRRSGASGGPPPDRRGSRSPGIYSHDLLRHPDARAAPVANHRHVIQSEGEGVLQATRDAPSAVASQGSSAA